MDSFSSLSPRRPGSADATRASGVGNGKSNDLPLRVFLVEDSPSVRDRLIDFLAEPGKVDVIGFADTETEAVRQLWTETVDVAIVDLNLREGTGMGVIESLRALHTAPKPTVVVLTNYAFPEFEVACRERGADYFFDKSTQFGALKMLLQSIERQRH